MFRVQPGKLSPEIAHSQGPASHQCPRRCHCTDRGHRNTSPRLSPGSWSWQSGSNRLAHQHRWDSHGGCRSMTGRCGLGTSHCARTGCPPGAAWARSSSCHSEKGHAAPTLGAQGAGTAHKRTRPKPPCEPRWALLSSSPMPVSVSAGRSPGAPQKTELASSPSSSTSGFMALGD